MAFEFLRDALGLAAAASAAGSMFGLGSGGESKATRQAAQRQAAIAEALANPQSPMFQQARQQAMEQSRTAQLQALGDYLGNQARQARRFQAGGGTSFYARNPRQDEAASRMVMQMGQNEQAKADAAARAQLTGAAGAYGTAMQGYDVAARARQQQRAAQLSGLIGGLYGTGEILGRLPLMGQPTQGPVQGSVNEPKSQNIFGNIFPLNRFTSFSTGRD